MALSRMGSVTCVVLLCLILNGCSAADNASPSPSGGSPIEPPSSANSNGISSSNSNPDTEPVWLLHGPYVPLLRMSAEQVKEVLGNPAKASEEGGQAYWEYPNLGLVIVLNKEKVFIVNQTQGKITESFRIGDPEEKAVTFAGGLEPSSMDPGAKVGRTYLPELDIKIWVRDGRVVKAQLMRPGKDN